MSSPLRIDAKDPGSQARTGVLRTAHGDIRTPAFVPLATKGSVRGMLPDDVRAAGHDIVLGNTFHLFLTPGHELVRHFGGLHRFMGWDGPIITDSGGFQVFSMGHGTVADEIKGRASHGAERHGKTLGITEEGVTFRSYLDGSKQFMGPEESMDIQHALGSDLFLAFDECTPFNVDRDYTARSTERTHRWLDRCIAHNAEHAQPHQRFYGIVQGGVYEDLRVASTEAVAARGTPGIAIGGSLGADKPQMYEVVSWSTAALDRVAYDRPRHLLGIGDVDDLIRGTELGIDTFDCAMPTRLGRHGMALVPDPDGRWRVDLTQKRWERSEDPILDGCPCPACSAGLSRGYLRYLCKAKEQTGQRLMTAHNLAFLGALMEDLRAGIRDGKLTEVAAALRAGATPGQLAAA